MKMLTKPIIKQLKNIAIGSTDGQGKKVKVIVKFFDPYGAGTWLITEGEQTVDGDWRFFGAATLGYGYEWGYTMLSQLTELVKFGRSRIERDRHFTGLTVADEWSD